MWFTKTRPLDIAVLNLNRKSNSIYMQKSHAQWRDIILRKSFYFITLIQSSFWSSGAQHVVSCFLNLLTGFLLTGFCRYYWLVQEWTQRKLRSTKCGCATQKKSQSSFWEAFPISFKARIHCISFWRSVVVYSELWAWKNSGSLYIMKWKGFHVVLARSQCIATLKITNVHEVLTDNTFIKLKISKAYLKNET